MLLCAKGTKRWKTPFFECFNVDKFSMKQAISQGTVYFLKQVVFLDETEHIKQKKINQNGKMLYYSKKLLIKLKNVLQLLRIYIIIASIWRTKGFDRFYLLTPFSFFRYPQSKQVNLSGYREWECSTGFKMYWSWDKGLIWSAFWAWQLWYWCHRQH